jgi:chorismate mutase
LTHIYERIIDVMRALQRNELASERNALQGQGTGAPPTAQQGSVASDPGSAPETGNEK